MSPACAIAIDRGAIARPDRRRPALPVPDGWTLAPGMVDLQVNGYGGLEIGADPAAVEGVAAALPAEGVTAFCPTLVTRSERGYAAAARALGAARRPPGGARVLGPHLEGPFLAPERVGAHRAEHLRTPSREAVDRLLDRFAPAIVTLAPELPQALAAIRRIRRAGALAAVGHTEADAATGRRAIAAGAGLLTHAPNAMRGIETREATALVAYLRHPRARVSVIADGVHVDPEVLGLIARAAGARLVAVSDATAPAGAEPGMYRLAGRRALSDGRRALLEDGALAGSVRGLGGAPAALAATGVPRSRAIAAATVAPRRLLGLPWRLAPGDPADLTLFDAGAVPRLAVIGGRVAYAAPGPAEDVAAALR